MNEIVNKFLLVGDKFIPEFTYSACGPCTREKQRIEKFMQTGNTDFIYRNELDKACLNMIWLLTNNRLTKKNSIRQSFKR